MAKRLGLEPMLLEADWRRGADPAASEAAPPTKAAGSAPSPSSTTRLRPAASARRGVRTAIDRAAHPALLLVDTISSLGSIDYRHDEWGVDVTVAGSQKGLMLPPGLSFNAISARAVAAAKAAKLARSYWDWQPMLEANADFSSPTRRRTNLLRGLHEALAMMQEEGLANVFARHARHGKATRAAVAGVGA